MGHIGPHLSRRYAQLSAPLYDTDSTASERYEEKIRKGRGRMSIRLYRTNPRFPSHLLSFPYLRVFNWVTYVHTVCSLLTFTSTISPPSPSFGILYLYDYCMNLMSYIPLIVSSIVISIHSATLTWSGVQFPHDLNCSASRVRCRDHYIQSHGEILVPYTLVHFALAVQPIDILWLL